MLGRAPLTIVVDASLFSGLRATLSGPAGGVVGYARTSFDSVPLIGFDMGGTSTDVSRFDGEFSHILETTTAGVTIQSPQLDIETVAAGGGSILFWENGLLRVGPESAGASPGPACYRKGGPLTITDANVFLGRLLPSHFPHIFGPNEDMPLDIDVVREKFEALAKQISRDTYSKSAEDIALGFLAVATEAMCNPIRTLSESRGHELSSHYLAVFGGAGGQAACDVALSLGISKILIPKFSSILSAVGIAKADLVHESQESFAGTTRDIKEIAERLEALTITASKVLQDQGYSQLATTEYLNLRYKGADATIMVAKPDDGDWTREFVNQHQQEYGFSHQDREVQVEDVRVRVSTTSEETTVSVAKQVKAAKANPIRATPAYTSQIYFSAWTNTCIFNLAELKTNTIISGPAIIVDATQTLLVVPGATATITAEHVVIDVADNATPQINDTIDPVQLSVFGHRFMSISEQMGRSLQKTAISVNIKERMDFSCALFDPEGMLVANAPHVPAMLGSMQFAVKWQAAYWRDKLRPGDVLLSNHPIAGGVHLPDLTVVTPVFDTDGKSIMFCE